MKIENTIVDNTTHLNRAEQRRAVKSFGSVEAAQSITRAIKGVIMKTTINLYSLAVAYVLANKCGYGDKKLAITMKQISSVFDEINAGTLDFKSIQEDMRARGIEFTDGEN